LREHTDDSVQHNLGLGEIFPGTFNENVFGGQFDFGVVTVDDRREG
jgi:hypothetical protein